MIVRRTIAIAAYAVLAGLLLARNSPREVRERGRFLAAYAPKDLAVRRLGGSSAAFDRRFFLFIESIRRRLPQNVSGVAIEVPDPSEAQLFLAAYQLAPCPIELAPSRVPTGWLVAAYGTVPPTGWTVLARVPGGALLAPASP